MRQSAHMRAYLPPRGAVRAQALMADTRPVLRSPRPSTSIEPPVTLDVAGEVMSDVEGGLTDEEPFVRFEEFSDFSINFLLRVPVREFTDQYLVRHELVKRIHERYGAEGIEIPFPIRTVYMREREGGTE